MNHFDEGYDGPRSTGGSGLMGAMSSKSPGANMPISKQSEMERVIDSLSGKISMVDELFASLVNRVSPVLRPELPRPERLENAKEPGYGSPLAQRLAEETYRLENIADRILQVRDRIEL